jgi:hypothetical protein
MIILAEVFLEWEMFYFFMFRHLFRKPCRSWDNVDECDIVSQATDNNTVRYHRKLSKADPHSPATLYS